LGDLLRELKQTFTLPDEVLKAIDLANRARIAAVHRSRSSVSDRDAMNAIFGALNVIMWYSSL
jgi:hypothetical protein